MSAAFELTQPHHHGKFDVTVYQLGWRLGGKGASGRGPSGRIEEHGLHLWMGFYDNAFSLMRACYEELGREPGSCPIVDWRDAFEPAPYVAVAEDRDEDTWQPWVVSLPQTEGLPGDPRPSGGPTTMADYFTQTVGLLGALFESLSNHPRFPGGSGRRRTLSPKRGSPGERLRNIVRYGELASLAAIVEAVHVLQSTLGDLATGVADGLVGQVLQSIATSARSQLSDLCRQDDELRRLWTILDLTLATLFGIVRFRLLTDARGFDAIDDYDCREWLLLNGASRESVDSGYMRGLYDLVFAYEDGDPSRARISAGQAMRSMARSFFTYRGSFFWRMQAGMGDVVFAPLYEVLARRGVRFEFFHRLTNVGLDTSRPGEPHVARLDFERQARVVGGGAYQPLVDVGGLPCWPAEPDWDQLVDGEAMAMEGRKFESFWEERAFEKRSLHVSRDFDFVVLGVGLGAVPHVASEILARDARWRAMVDHVKTVSTQAFQIWLRSDMRNMGWRGPAVTLSGFVEPFDTWADMKHVTKREAWSSMPGALAYFCNVLPDDPTLDPASTGYPTAMHERVRENAVRFLRTDLPRLWTRCSSPDGDFRWEELIDAGSDDSPPAGEARFATQFWTANVNPSDRYALSLPGSTAFRISPLDRTYDNLTIAGDWTSCGFNAGCVEAAVMSGRLAAHALSNQPPLEEIPGFDHP